MSLFLKHLRLNHNLSLAEISAFFKERFGFKHHKKQMKDVSGVLLNDQN